LLQHNFLGKIPMSKHILNPLKLAASIAGLFCLTLAIAPTASAETNISNGGGTNVSNGGGGNVSNGGGGNVSNGGGGSVSTGGGGSSNNGGGNPNGGGYSADTISQAQSYFNALAAAQSNYEQAASRLAALEASQPKASSGPVRYGREPGDMASCGCLNPDTAGAGSAELAAAKAAEADAAAELAKAKAASRQFLESVKGSSVAGNLTYSSPIW
jgi:hypothetical protein